jgi:hypothetical protein
LQTEIFPCEYTLEQGTDPARGHQGHRTKEADAPKNRLGNHFGERDALRYHTGKLMHYQNRWSIALKEYAVRDAVGFKLKFCETGRDHNILQVYRFDGHCGIPDRARCSKITRSIQRLTYHVLIVFSLAFQQNRATCAQFFHLSLIVLMRYAASGSQPTCARNRALIEG